MIEMNLIHQYVHQYINRILLNEDSRGNIVKLLKLPKKVADAFDAISHQNSYQLALGFKAYIDGLDDNAKESSDVFDNFMKNYGNKLNSLFLKKPQLKAIFVTFMHQHEGPSYWQLPEFLAEHQPEVDPGRIIFTDSDGGTWRIISTDKVSYATHCIKMQHCADTFGEVLVYRDSNGEPHVTAMVEDGIIYGPTGKQNKFPTKRYCRKLLELVNATSLRLEQKILNAVKRRAN